MPPVSLARIASGDTLRSVSRSISSSLSSPPTSDPIIIKRGAGSIHQMLAQRSASSPPVLDNALHLLKRANILAISTTYAGLNDGPPPGTVVGIVLGAVGGFLLALWILATCFNVGGGRFAFGPFGGRSETIIEEEVIRHRSRSRSQSARRRSRSRSMSEVRRSPAPRSRRETIIVEERRTSRPAEETEDDVVEVIEEHSPARRPSRRESKRVSGFRTVDPAEIGGGDRPMRKVSRR